MKYYKTAPEEQETNINMDYFNNTLHLYSSRPAVIKRYIGKLGEPNKKDFIGETLVSASWIIPFSNKKAIIIALSKTLLIGQMKNK